MNDKAGDYEVLRRQAQSDSKLYDDMLTRLKEGDPCRLALHQHHHRQSGPDHSQDRLAILPSSPLPPPSSDYSWALPSPFSAKQWTPPSVPLRKSRHPSDSHA